jgi:transcriptional antiterminator NusG
MATVGDFVRVLDGRFKDFCGEVRSVDVASRVAIVGVVLFGRETPAEVSLDQVELAERPDQTSPDRPRDPTDILDD